MVIFWIDNLFCLYITCQRFHRQKHFLLSTVAATICLRPMVISPCNSVEANLYKNIMHETWSKSKLTLETRMSWIDELIGPNIKCINFRQKNTNYIANSLNVNDWFLYGLAILLFWKFFFTGTEGTKLYSVWHFRCFDSRLVMSEYKL
jgi:hypothetical protein